MAKEVAVSINNMYSLFSMSIHHFLGRDFFDIGNEPVENQTAAQTSFSRSLSSKV